MGIEEIDKISGELTRAYLEQRIINEDILNKAIIFFNQYYDLKEHPITRKNIEKLADIDFSLKLDFLHWKACNPVTEEQIKQFYRTTPFEFFKNLFKNMDIMHYERILKDLLLPYLEKNKCHKILDYGGGSGYLSILLHQLGFEVTFAEINTISIEWMKYLVKELAIGVNIIDLYEKDIEDNYDIIILKDVLEHLPNTQEILGKLKPKTKTLFIIPEKLTKSEDYLPMHFCYDFKGG